MHILFYIFKIKFNYRYGDEASETTRHALYAAGHTTLASFQLYELGPRSIAGHMARKAGIQFICTSSNGTLPLKNNKLQSTSFSKK